MEDSIGEMQCDTPQDSQSKLREKQLCENCGSQLEHDWILCPDCGLIYKCPQCKRVIIHEWKLCPTCGTRIEQPPLAHVGIRREDFAESAHRQLNELQTRLGDLPRPAYELITARVRFPSWLFWVIVGESFFLIHYILALVVGTDVIGDFSWMLGVLIAVGMTLVVGATKLMRRPAEELLQLMELDAEEFSKFYSDKLHRALSGRNLVFSGFLFGVANMLLGWTYGIWYEHIIMRISISIQFFVIGFICGMAIWGILGTILMIRDVGKQRLIVQLDHMDGRGGTGFIGELVLKYALITFFMGLLIATYIIVTPWSNKQDTFVRVLMFAWIAVPYLASLAIFVIPVTTIHQQLARLRRSELGLLRIQRKELRATASGRLYGSIHAHTTVGNYIAQQIEEIEELLRKWRSLNVSPYDFSIAIRFFVSLLIPTIIFVIEILSRFI